MIGALACDSHAAFNDLCTSIARHDPTGLAGPAVERLLGPIVLFILLLVVGRTVRRMVDRTLDRAGGDVQVRTLVDNVVTAASFALATLAALVVAGLDVSVLLTFGGLASLAVGLAFQDVLRNLLAGIFLLVEKPFRLGDLVTVNGHTGVVHSIELRTTTLGLGDGREAILPNLTAFNNIVVNQSAADRRQYTVSVRLPLDVDLEAVSRAVREALAGVDSLSGPSPSLVPRLDADSTVILDCRYWLDYRAFDPDTIGAEVARLAWSAARRAQAAGHSGGDPASPAT